MNDTNNESREELSLDEICELYANKVSEAGIADIACSEAAKDEAANNGMVNGAVVDNGTVNVEAADNGAVNGAVNVEAADNGVVNVEAANNGAANYETASNEAANNLTANNETSNNEAFANGDANTEAPGSVFVNVGYTEPAATDLSSVNIWSAKKDIVSENNAEVKTESDNIKVDVNKRKKKGKKALTITLCTLFGLILAGYFTMVVLMTKYFYPNTKINGGDYSFSTVEEANNYLESLYNGYGLKVKLRNADVMIYGSDIDYKADFTKELNDIKASQNPFLWFTCFEKREYTIGFEVSYSEDKLDQTIDALGFLNSENMLADENPGFELTDSMEVVIVEGKKGTKLDENMSKTAIKRALNDAEIEVNLEKHECYVEGVFNSASEKVVAAKDRINVILMADITYLYGNYEIRIPKEDIYKMLDITSNYNVTVNRGLVKDYLVAFAEKHDTYGTTRKFKSHNGSYKNVVGKEYGWKIDVDTELDNLYNDIAAGRTVKREPAFLHTAYAYDGESDIGKTYCEVDLGNQKVYCYINGALCLESECVTGNVSAGHRTPGGLYSIRGKQMHAILRGRDYETPVSYWMPFNGGIGFHDATWRRKFGGNIYMTNGSHGCVNMPLANARDLYKLIEKGMPVVCYWD